MVTQLASPETTSQTIEDPHLVNLAGTLFYIRWEHVGYGSSFFLPTTITPKQALAELRPIARHLGMKLIAHARCEYGRFGVRVWRIR